MTAEEIKDLCQRQGITFIPHHACAICGATTGWYLFWCWPPYEVAYSNDCNCGFVGNAHGETWEDIAKWVNESEGNLRSEYKQVFGIND